MKKLFTTVVPCCLFAISFTGPSNAMESEWVEGTCGEPVTPYVDHYELAVQEHEHFDYVDFMEQEELSADGSVSPIW